jgi:hypothetical protein
MKAMPLVMKAEHTVASYNGRDFTSEIATILWAFLLAAATWQ